MQAPVFNLFYAVDNQSWDSGGGDWSKVSQGGLDKNTTINRAYKSIENTHETMRKMYLCILDGSTDSCRITRKRTLVTTFWMGHNPAILAAEIHLAKLCSSSTWHTELRLDHLTYRERC